MQICRADQYYGAALRHLIHCGHSVENADDKPGDYRLNSNSTLLMKYAANSANPWHFTITAEEVELLISDQSKAGLFGEAYLLLICGRDSICILRVEEWLEVLNVPCHKTQFIRIDRPFRSQMSVTGSSGKLENRISRSRIRCLA